MNSSTNSPSLKEVFLVFLRLGFLGFGGPAAHVAMMRQEVVEKRGWLTEQEFIDLWGATQFIPGPNSTELAIHIGHKLGGWKGLLIAGTTFILPAFLLVLMLAVTYQQFSGISELQKIFAGIRPVILAIILDAIFKLRAPALKDASCTVIAVLSMILVYLGVSEVLILFAVAAGYTAFFPRKLSAFIPVTDTAIFFYFLKIGSILFGSGYVLISFLQADLVEAQKWLTPQQLLDAVTIGQVTPGPVFTTATFLGYLLNGYKGSVLATVGIFLPSFIFVALSAPVLSRLQQSLTFRKFLDGVNAVSFAFLVHVFLVLSGKSFTNIFFILIGLVSFILIRRFKNLNTAWLIMVAAVLAFFIPQP